MKKIVFHFITLTLILSMLTACGSGKTATDTATPTAADTSSTIVKPSNTDTPSAADTPAVQPAEGGKNGTAASQSTEKSTESAAQVQSSLMKEAYRTALEQICTEHKLPDGTDLGSDDSFGPMSDNHFAIYDIDSDGKDELLVVISSAPMAGMMEQIYRYDEAVGKLVSQFVEFPALAFYSDGHIKADWSHNQGHAGESFWPYTLYVYDAQSDSYKVSATVDAWDKKIADKNYDGEAFPDKIDANGHGIVFLLTVDDSTKTLSKEDYENWYNQQLGNATEVKIEYTAITKENVSALK